MTIGLSSAIVAGISFDSDFVFDRHKSPELTTMPRLPMRAIHSGLCPVCWLSRARRFWQAIRWGVETRGSATLLGLILVVAVVSGALCERGLGFGANRHLFADEQNWPEFQGPTGNGLSTAASLPVTWSETENVRWKTPIHGKAWSSPVIYDGQIWLTTATRDGHDNYAICVDQASGKVLHDKHLFHNENPSVVLEFNSYGSPSPVIEAGRVYITFGSYGTACLSTKTGEVLWSRRDLPCEHHRGPGSSPILHGDLFILHYDGFDYQYVVALNKQTGETVWKVDRDVDYGTDDGDIKKAYATPAVLRIDGRDQLISPTSKACVAYDIATGKELWRVRYKEFSVAIRPVFGHGLIFINTGFGKAELLAVKQGLLGDITETGIAWRSSRSIPSKPAHLLIDDLLFMVHDQGQAICLDARTGEVVWQNRLGGNYSASPIAGAGKIYFLSEEGNCSVIKADRQFELLATNTLPDGFMASPAVSGRALYLRSRTALYRIEE
jgi:outer membrane protein assembly factor BamB